MPFCTKCGTSVTDEMAFCPGCGTQLNAAAPVVPAYAAPTAYTYAQPQEYQVVLQGRGTGKVDDALYLMEEVLGYTQTQAKELLSLIPVQIACSLTLTQARYVAQAFAEYGMEVFVADGMGNYVELGDQTTASIFDLQGNFLPAAAAALTVLTAANRVRRAVQWHIRGPKPPLFSLGFRHTSPLPPRRRPMRSAVKRPPARKSILPMKPKAPAPRRPAPARKTAPARKHAPPRSAGPRRGGMGGPGGIGGPGGFGGNHRH